MHPITYCGNSRVSVGCKNETIEDCIGELGQKLMDKNNYSKEQIEEYKKYFEIMLMFSKI